MDADIQRLIPQNKYDLAQVKSVIEMGYPKVAPILPQLLEWLQDMNWPVARPLASFLTTIGEPLIPHVVNILRTDDHIWKYWVLSSVVSESSVMAKALSQELERLANTPTKEECEEDLPEIAKDILEKIKADK